LKEEVKQLKGELDAKKKENAELQSQLSVSKSSNQSKFSSKTTSFIESKPQSGE
jgi:ribosomal protein L29